MNSAREAGGAPPVPLHSRRPPPQSPVVQFPCLPDGSKLQPVRAQKRPDQPVGATTSAFSFGLSCRPPLISVGWPAPDWVAGHIVCLHLFCNVKVAALDPERSKEKKQLVGMVLVCHVEKGKTTCEEWEK